MATNRTNSKATNKPGGKSGKRNAAAERRAKIEEARRKERARDRRNRILTIAACMVVLAATVGGGWWLWASTDGDDPATPPAGEASEIEGVQTWDELGRNHVEGQVDYPMNPPAGGDHAQAWMNCDADVYETEIANENAVHSLEHGAVWVTYNDAAAEADIATLSERVSATSYTLMSPKPDQESPIVLTAWGNQLALDTADDPRVETFFNTFVQGAQTPEPGAACTGGLTE
ncbi:DUF3105 domain-containing protein [Streptomyces millisiae]|uniref:DUF3105 domain-containing protein n=1 Tax=Streptomyces millisiae TaxID=3075542 RepID=A0ABU2LMS6_9ACTN|nr:DUF3105 domain-containing protein [Streptomyces sp. DSM 44918]MDT0318896.1 DUF3105 domain-containing protein [Streptomyces sp. DSM 44918]